MIPVDLTYEELDDAIHNLYRAIAGMIYQVHPALGRPVFRRLWRVRRDELQRRQRYLDNNRIPLGELWEKSYYARVARRVWWTW